MKTALYIEDGLEQIVLTPENSTERDILHRLHEARREVELKRGSFFECQGGWVRHELSTGYPHSMVSGEAAGPSTMIVLRKQEDTSE